MDTQPIRPFPPRRDYASLSVRDLLDAREAYHVHLSSIENVVATAIGRYLIRRGDWYENNPPGTPPPPGYVKPATPRTLANSVVRPWSWPAVLVFVRRPHTPDHLEAEDVPRALYLPDGRVIPTCTVLAAPDESLPAPVAGRARESGLVGGGYACVRHHQGVDHQGTIACLVTREGSYYALTNRHVAGRGGEEIRAWVRTGYQRIGSCAGLASGELRVPEAFPSWPGERTYLTLDAGLIRIDDVEAWTSQAFGIGEIGECFDATESSVILDLIGCPVRGFGGASGLMEGEIRALFFRYQSLGGIDRVTDLLIGPAVEKSAGARRPTAPFTQPGDSGTLWFYDPPTHGEIVGGGVQAHQPPARGRRARRLRPVAMQWGGQRFLTEGGGSSAFALASFVSTICRELRVEIERGWSTGHDEYWGKIGHFAIGWKACDRVAGNVGLLMKANQGRIGFGDEVLGKGSEFRMGQDAFVPLADVPDYVWVHSHPNEPVQHFADIDIHDIDGGDSLLERGVQDPQSVAASVWKQYFDGFAAAGVGPDAGTLPFRVWQLWQAMVDYLRAGDLLRFVCAGGVMAHYVGDASQPLHCSYLHHGRPPMHFRHGRKYPAPKDSDEFKEFKKTREAKIHAIYEETMLEVDAPTALATVTTLMAGVPSAADGIRTGHDAALAVLRLMHAAQQRLAPKKILAADDPALGPTARAARLWAHEKIRDATLQSLAESVGLLADLWTAAWTVGDGDLLDPQELREFAEDEVQPVYRSEPDFVPSLSLAAMVESGELEAP